MICSEMNSQIRRHLASEEVETRCYPKDSRFIVTDCGNVFKIKKDSSLVQIIPRVGAQGYYQFSRCYYIHRVVCETYHGEPKESGLVVRHLDSNKLNNRANNLTWGTHTENQADRVKQLKDFGWLSFIDQELIEAIKRVSEAGVSVKDIATLTKMSVKRIEAIRGWCSLPDS